MAIKKTQMYRKNLDTSKTNLYPLTEAQYVTMENGQTVQEVLSDRDSDKYTPTIENSSSMFRVGEGDNVDLSSSVVDGAYAGCILKGQTLVNIHKSATYSLSRQNEGWYNNLVSKTNRVSFEIIDTSIGGWKYLSLGKVNLDMLKPNTKYLVYFGIASFPNNVSVRFMNGDSTNRVSNEVTIPKGDNKAILTTTSEIAKSDQVLYVTFSNVLGKVDIGNAMIFEYQEGMENWDIPYFEGICDVKSPILSNVGKNLFTTNNMRTGNIAGNSSVIEGDDIGGNWQVTDYIPVKPLIEYYHSTSLYKFEKASFYDINKKIIYGTGVNNFKTRVISTPHQCAYVRYVVMKDSSTNNSLSLEELVSNNDIVVTQGGSNIAYEPYKSNTTTFDQKDGKTIVLRSLPNGVCDTLNVETGEHVQRIGEVTLTPEIINSANYGDDGNSKYLYFSNTNVIFPNRKEGQIVCDKIPYVNTYGSFAPTFSIAQNGGVVIFVFTSDFNTSNNFTAKLNFVKEFVSKNGNITIQYPLATPIVSTIDVQGFPYAYTNGHVQLSSGSIEQSLTPKVEYSLSANKTGQINSNTKRVSAHQKQLDDFEAMMLTQMVQSAYDKAILQFDYEMQMMSLGGE